MQVTIARTAMDQLAPGIGKELDHFIQKFSRWDLICKRFYELQIARLFATKYLSF